MVEAVLWADSPVFELNPRVDQGTVPRSALRTYDFADGGGPGGQITGPLSGAPGSLNRRDSFCRFFMGCYQSGTLSYMMFETERFLLPLFHAAIQEAESQ